jgi:FkbM family methyltransferase
MMSVNQVKKILLAALFGNSFSQKVLEKRIKFLQRLTGIGSGGNVNNSGEKGLFKKLKTFKKPSYCIFDVGANKGNFALLALRSLNGFANFSIHCFEPSRITFKMLSDNLTGKSFVTLNNIGLGKEQGEFDLFYECAGAGTASLTKRNLDYLGVTFSQSEKVFIERLDNYCSAKRVEYIDLLKIDVEGHELDVLQGAEGMLKNNQIGMISFEFGGCNIDTRTFFKDFFYFFKQYGFHLYRMTPSGYFYPLLCYSELYEQFRTTNFVAIHKNNP